MQQEALSLTTLKGTKVMASITPDNKILRAQIDGVGTLDIVRRTFAYGYAIAAKHPEVQNRIQSEWMYEGCVFLKDGHEAVFFLSRESSLLLRERDQELHQKKIAEYARRHAEAQAKLELTVPGLQVLTKAHDAWEEYRRQFSAAMENEHNDGACMPRKPEYDIDALCAEYPRAALYLKADSYEGAENYAKATAGTKTKEVLANGGSIEEAASILDNWTADVFID